MFKSEKQKKQLVISCKSTQFGSSAGVVVIESVRTSGLQSFKHYIEHFPLQNF
jgi:hypothetical protein